MYLARSTASHATFLRATLSSIIRFWREERIKEWEVWEKRERILRKDVKVSRNDGAHAVPSSCIRDTPASPSFYATPWTDFPRNATTRRFSSIVLAGTFMRPLVPSFSLTLTALSPSLPSLHFHLTKQFSNRSWNIAQNILYSTYKRIFFFFLNSFPPLSKEAFHTLFIFIISRSFILCKLYTTVGYCFTLA